MRRGYPRVALIAAVSLVAARASASAFKTVPTRVVLEGKSRSAALKIQNEGEEEVTVQLAGKRWFQGEQGVDGYEDTSDLLFFPKMAAIPPKSERTVRIGYRGTADTTQERSYRIFIQELPVKQPGEIAIRLALTITIPVFVKPAAEQVAWKVEAVALSKELLTVGVTNAGNTHVMISKIRATATDAGGSEIFSNEVPGWYTLPGASKIFAIPVRREDCLNSASIRVGATPERGEAKEALFHVAPEMCTPRPTEPPRARPIPTQMRPEMNAPTQTRTQ